MAIKKDISKLDAKEKIINKKPTIRTFRIVG
jgi:hypothetical protein